MILYPQSRKENNIELLYFLNCPLSLKSKATFRTSLAVQWLRLYTSTEGVMGLIPDWRTKILHATLIAKNIKQVNK